MAWLAYGVSVHRGIKELYVAPDLRSASPEFDNYYRTLRLYVQENIDRPRGISFTLARREFEPTQTGLGLGYLLAVSVTW
jgi:hypothetical protein